MSKVITSGIIKLIELTSVIVIYSVVYGSEPDNEWVSDILLRGLCTHTLECIKCKPETENDVPRIPKPYTPLEVVYFKDYEKC